MLAKIWKRLFLIICIIAIIINIGHKLVSRTSLKEQLIQLATTESLSTSINNFVKEKYGELTDEEKREFSNPIGEFVDAFGKDGKSKNQVDDEANNEVNNDNNNDDNNVNPVDAEGNAEALGQLMVETEEIFNRQVAPLSKALQAPKLHETLHDPHIQPLVYGGKGVGSHGDGSVQFLARDEQSQIQLVDYLNGIGMKAYKLTLHPIHTVRRAIIPVAGFGTRLYPATRIIRKDFFPIPCPDGKVRPVILILLEELVKSGIEEICLVLGSEEERMQYAEFFERPLSDEHLRKLSPENREYENHILSIGKRLHYVYQRNKRGFGHAVYQAVDFTHDEPVLLLLGDTLYRSKSNKPCALQLIEKYERYNQMMVSIHDVPLAEVSHYGILSGVWEDKDETILNVSAMNEKPKASYAEEYLGVRDKEGRHHYYSVFGQYILTPEVFEQLGKNIRQADEEHDMQREIELTTALEQVRQQSGMIGVRLKGEMFDMGNPTALSRTIMNYSKE